MADDARERGDREQPPTDEAALSARFQRLGERLGHVHPDRPSESSPGQRPTADPSAIARGFRLSTELVAGVLVGAAVGWLIDRWLGISPWGMIVFLLLGFAAVAIRGLLFAVVSDPYLLVAAQVFDGIAASVFSVMVPFVVADIARGTGRFNLSLGIVGTGTGIGASLSTTLAGYVSDHFGSAAAFLGLAGIAAVGLALVWTLMPETRRATE